MQGPITNQSRAILDQVFVKKVRGGSRKRRLLGYDGWVTIDSRLGNVEVWGPFTLEFI